MVNIISLTCLLLSFSNVNNQQNYTIYTEKVVNNQEINFKVWKINNTGNSGWTYDEGDMIAGSLQDDDGLFHSYYSIVKFDVPPFEIDDISSSYFTLYKKTGYGRSINLSYTFNEMIFNQNSSEINTIGIGDYEIAGNSFTINLTNIIKTAILEDKTTIYLKISKPSYESTGIVLFGDQSNYYYPKFSIYTFQKPNDASAGGAFDFEYIPPNPSTAGKFVNCLLFAIGRSLDSPVSTSNMVVDLGLDFCKENLDFKIVPYVQNELLCRYNINSRVIENHDSLIYPFEYRVAFRIDDSENGKDYHFMRQCSTGQWADKRGFEAASILYDISKNPSNINWGRYDSDIVYFAFWSSNQ